MKIIRTVLYLFIAFFLITSVISQFSERVFAGDCSGPGQCGGCCGSQSCSSSDSSCGACNKSGCYWYYNEGACDVGCSQGSCKNKTCDYSCDPCGNDYSCAIEPTSPPETHMGCSSSQCVEKQGPGPDKCSDDSDCEHPTPSNTPIPTRTPTPSPTRVPCGGPCTVNTQCDLSCSICTPDHTCQAPTVTPIPTRTPTPIPTNTPTPRPSATPIPTLTPTLTLTPTPTIPPECKCDGLVSSGTFGSGSTVTLNTFAKVENPDTNPATVLNMVYHVFQNGSETDTSSAIPASAPVRTTDSSGKPIDRYSTTWSYTIPAMGYNPTSFRIKAQISCAWKTAQNTVSSSQHAEAPTDKSILSFWNRIVDAVKQILGNQQNQSLALKTSENQQSRVLGTNTLQLGTFHLATNVQTQCTEVSFDLAY